AEEAAARPAHLDQEVQGRLADRLAAGDADVIGALLRFDDLEPQLAQDERPIDARAGEGFAVRERDVEGVQLFARGRQQLDACLERFVERGLEMQPADSERMGGNGKKRSRDEKKQGASVYSGPGLAGSDVKGVLTVHGAGGSARLDALAEDGIA